MTTASTGITGMFQAKCYLLLQLIGQYYSSYNKGEGGSSGVSDNRAYVGERRERGNSGARTHGLTELLVPVLLFILYL